jgi:hypothetical protein
MSENYLNGEIFMDDGKVKRRTKAANLKKSSDTTNMNLYLQAR